MKKRSFILVVLMLICSVFCLVGCTGPQGEQGIQGPKGDTGAAGKDGIDGETGEQGPKGDRGSKGETGPQGEKGDKGDPGEKGDPGKNVEFSVDSTGIKWRYEGDAEWQSLLTFDDLEGYSKKYSVQFDLAGGTSAEIKDLSDVLYKQELTLAAPTKEGCVFVGWSDGKEIYTEKYQVLGDVKLTAVWGYEVTLDLNGGEIVGTYDNVEELKNEFLSDYYTWKGADIADNVSIWDANAWKFFNEPAYSAKWRPLLQYLNDVEVSQANAEKPEDAAATSGHDLYPYLEDALAGKDLHALYPDNGEYCVAFSLNGFLGTKCVLSMYHYTADYSSSEVQNKVLEYFIPSKATKYVVTCGEQLVLPKVAKGDLVVRTWTEGENSIGLIATPTKACTLTAQFGVEVQLVAGDDTTNPIKETITSPLIVGENDAEYTLPTLTRDHYTFLGWFDGETEVKTVKNTDSYKKLTAKWQGDEHKVEFDMNYAEATTTLDAVKTVYGSKVGDLPEATRENKVFDGWYLEPECTNELTSNTIVTGDIKVYAKWIEPSVSITFDTNGGERAVTNANDVKTVFLTDFYNWCVAKGAFQAADLSLNDFIGTNFNGKWFCYVGGAGNPSSLYTNYNKDTQVNYMVDYTSFKGATPAASEDTNNVYFLGDKDMYAKYSPFMSYICTIFGDSRAWTEISSYYVFELGRYMQAFNGANPYVTTTQLEAVPTGMESLTINAPITKDVILGTKVELSVAKADSVFLGWADENGELVEEATRALEKKTLKAVYVANTLEKFVIHKNTQAAAGDYAVYEGMNILKNGYSFKTSTYTERVALTYSNGEFTVVEIVHSGTANSAITATWDYLICGYDGTYKAGEALTALNLKVGDKLILSKNIVGLAEGCYNIDAYIVRA